MTTSGEGVPTTMPEQPFLKTGRHTGFDVPITENYLRRPDNTPIKDPAEVKGRVLDFIGDARDTFTTALEVVDAEAARAARKVEAQAAKLSQLQDEVENLGVGDAEAHPESFVRGEKAKKRLASAEEMLRIAEDEGARIKSRLARAQDRHEDAEKILTEAEVWLDPTSENGAIKTVKQISIVGADIQEKKLILDPPENIRIIQIQEFLDKAEEAGTRLTDMTVEMSNLSRALEKRNPMNSVLPGGREISAADRVKVDALQKKIDAAQKEYDENYGAQRDAATGLSLEQKKALRAEIVKEELMLQDMVDRIPTWSTMRADNRLTESHHEDGTVEELLSNTIAELQKIERYEMGQGKLGTPNQRREAAPPAPEPTPPERTPVEQIDESLSTLRSVLEIEIGTLTTNNTPKNRQRVTNLIYGVARDLGVANGVVRGGGWNHPEEWRTDTALREHFVNGAIDVLVEVTDGNTTLEDAVNVCLPQRIAQAEEYERERGTTFDRYLSDIANYIRSSGGHFNHPYFGGNIDAFADYSAQIVEDLWPGRNNTNVDRIKQVISRGGRL